MTSSKPYLIRGLHAWVLDNGLTPHLLVDTGNKSVRIPEGIAVDSKVVLNLGPMAVEQLEMTNDHLSFSAKFSGVVENIYCPMSSVLAIYARENGEGMMFADESNPEDTKAEGEKSVRPRLTIVK